MHAWQHLDSTTLPSGKILSLHRRGDEFVIRIDRFELMNSRIHASEDALATLTTKRLQSRSAPHILIGGLGMGFTLASALNTLPDDASLTVAELVPAVIKWNRGPLAALNAHALDDPRTTLHQGDVRELIDHPPNPWDAILLDVDNGPEGLTQTDNDRIYSPDGLLRARKTLKPNGILAIWTASQDGTFEGRLKKAGFRVTTEAVRAHGKKGRRHYIWLAKNR